MTNAEGKKRNLCTVIFYMLVNNDKSMFHRLRSDEHWFFHQGQTLEILLLKNGKIEFIKLGNDIERGESPQALMPANSWFAAHVENSSGFSLVSCSVSPGFDFVDFELADRKKLTKEYPSLSEIIKNFT
jgi:hypothetical protein